MLFMAIIMTNYCYSQNKKTTNVKSYSVEEAKNYVIDFFDFYKNDTRYDNIEVRKITKNTFHIKVITCDAGEHCYESNNSEIDFTKIGNPPKYVVCSKNSIFWSSSLYKLTIKPNSKYLMENLNQ